MVKQKEILTLANQITKILYRTRNANTKLGDTYSWSIVAGDTCPGQTNICASLCYAKRGHFAAKNVKTAHKRNTEMSKRPDFAEALSLALSHLPAGLLRLHPAGDFYDIPYIQAWTKALKENQHIKAFGFTRSWRLPDMEEALNNLRNVENMQLFASIDEETGPAPAGWRIATMSQLSKADIKKGRVAIPDAMCPQQLDHKKVVTCGSCGLCPQHRTEPSGSLVAIAPKGSYAFGVTFARH